MKVGDWVEVRSEVEILQTLDEYGCLEGLPFMPEMFRYCGRTFQIYKCAHKTCDALAYRSRRMTRTVHLDTRCSGEAHGGCQSACLLLWKEDWLQAVNSRSRTASSQAACSAIKGSGAPSPTKDDVVAYASLQEGEAVRYRCQATQIREASSPLPWWDLRQYVEDLRSGNVCVWKLGGGIVQAFWLTVSRWGLGAGRLSWWVHNRLRFLWQGAAFPRRVGRIPRGKRTPVANLHLQPGELVRVRPLDEIDETLDTQGQNRGLYFDPEQAPYTNKIFRVKKRVDRIISEETGRLIELKTPTVVLDSVVCQGHSSSCRMFCPKSAYLLWREVWLQRVNESGDKDD